MVTPGSPPDGLRVGKQTQVAAQKTALKQYYPMQLTRVYKFVVPLNACVSARSDGVGVCKSKLLFVMRSLTRSGY